MAMSVKEAQGIAFEALRAIVKNSDFYNMKDLVGRELDITDEILDESVEVLFSKPNIVIDAKKFADYDGRLRSRDFYTKCTTLWDIPYQFIPRHVFHSGFEAVEGRLPSDSSGVRNSDPAAKELNITWINIPEAAS
ncbi:MAG: hypothetical protein WCE94_15380 [Candidatus Methanoperedens sp.]|jgi:hypothetical protein